MEREKELHMDTDNKRKRLLCIVGGMNAGGAETFLMKIYRALDKKKYQMDFYVAKQEEGYYDKEIITMGGNIYYSIPKSKNIIKSFVAIKEIVRREKYYYVMRVSQHSISAIDLLAAKQGGAKTLVYRSSNSGTGGGRVNRILHFIFRWLTIIIPTVRIAPSTEAAEFMFGKNCIKNRKAIIVKNAIAIEDFKFDQERRANIRWEFGIEEKFVVGHVGRFNHQKNHCFLVEIFSEIVKKNDNSVLLLVGKGELENEIKGKIKLLNLEDKVIFTGVRADVPDILMAMDVFIFPSYFEGMPNTVIEAQATGLKCIVSDSITREAQITDRVSFESLDSIPEEWAAAAIENDNEIGRMNMAEYLKNNGYDINLSVKEFENIIFTS